MWGLIARKRLTLYEATHIYTLDDIMRLEATIEIQDEIDSIMSQEQKK